EIGSLLSKENNLVESPLPIKKEENKDVIEKLFLEETQNLFSKTDKTENKEKDDSISFGIEEERWTFDNYLEDEKNLSKSKILVFDLDGTLLNSNHKVNPENIKALHSASEKGNKVIIATGRCYDQITETVNAIGNVVDYAIINNGALIYDNNKNFIIQNANPLSTDMRSFFVRTAFDNKISFLAYSELDLYAFIFPKDFQKFSIYVNENTVDLSNLSKQDLETYLNSSEINIYNFSAYHEEMSESDWIEMFKSFKNKNKCNITSALKGYIDIYSPTSKYFGYLKLKEIINCQDDDVYFFGDSNNDYDLLSYLPNSIAMGNANNRVKDAAKYVIDNNDSNAISEFLKNNNLA
ncbi:MAG: HAD family hydrolase, partial [Malacoplasma sp.]|nr:HAD family hydrolase [Malacoplasma sp.]